MSIIRPSYALNNTIPTADFPLRIGVTPALWLDGADSSTLISDGAASFAAASSQSLSITDASSNQTLRSGNSVYMSCWVRNIGALGSAALIDKCATAGGTYLNEYRLAIGGGGQQASIMMVDGTGTIRTATNSVQNVGVSTWSHVGAWHDGNNIYVSVNNNTPATVSCVGNNRSTNPFSLGGNNGTTPGNFLTGYIDSAVFCKNVNVSFTDLNTYLYNSGAGRRSSDFKASSYYLNGNPSGAVSWWDLDERSGTRNDRIGTNHLTDNNTVGYAAGVASGAVQFDGDPITSWQDKSGNARHALSASSSTRPTYKTSIQNSKSIARFDGTDDYLSYTGTMGISGSNGRTLFTVQKEYNTLTGFPFTFMHGPNTAYGAWGTCSYNAQIGLAIVTENLMANISAGSYSIVSSQISGTKGVAWRNGTVIGTQTTNTPNTTDANYIVGAYTSSNQFWNGDICEIIYYPTNLTTSQRVRVERYLGNKWGITVT